ncbi:EAL domain-containing protein [Zoogloea sp.]|uniref:putative bifunctional diguanylate cyclase/phosphodiesterase n=1 Tax=Zoogloea sp. TaxID=49181 RepID=UPI00261F702E|nr:EAL domain-containing protein [Zoogloea sp.]MDD3355096.1 EAL domain-containing protein [Zoogloea sp.]
MNREHILAILYDLTMVIGSETKTRPLLTKTLQRLLYHTSFPTGVVLLTAQDSGSAPSYQIITAVGDFGLAEQIGQSITLPPNLTQGEAELLADSDLPAALPCARRTHRACLRLPLPGHGVILLLAERAPHSELPLTRIFQPVLANLSRAIVLCRNSESYINLLASERDQARIALGESEERFLRLGQAAPDAIVMLDEEGRVTYWNPAAERLFGFTTAEIHGQDAHSLIMPAHYLQRFQQGFSHFRRTGHGPIIGQAVEMQGRRKDGSEFPLELSISSLQYHGRWHAIGILRDVTARKEAEQQIEHLAFYDGLTTLPNRRLLLDRLRLARAECLQDGSHGALVFIDLDNFKLLNDTSGHEAGNQLLREVAQRLLKCAGETNSVARPGADEFVVLLRNLSSHEPDAATQAKILGETIMERLNQPYLLDGRSHHSTPSVGITLFGQGVETEEELLKQADIAMYQAKAAGRNTLRFFDPDMQAALAARADLENALRAALEKNELILHYQAQVGVDERISGAEALIRWLRPGHGLISPNQFIPLAEETGLILPLGIWVLRAACQQLQRWSTDARTQELCLAINVSARQFRHPNFVSQVQFALASSGAPASRLKLELTESLVLDDVDDTIRKMRALRTVGVHFSMDDFGTGYSSLAYLTRLPLDQLKIDQSFVRKLPGSPGDAAVVQTIISLTHGLNLRVIAEGVETEAQRRFLERCGCNHWQGYLFSTPEPLAEFEKRLGIIPQETLQ